MSGYDYHSTVLTIVTTPLTRHLDRKGHSGGRVEPQPACKQNVHTYAQRMSRGTALPCASNRGITSPLLLLQRRR